MVKNLPAAYPKAVLNVPVVREQSEVCPIAVLYLAVVPKQPAQAPIKVLLIGDVQKGAAPCVKHAPAQYPTAVL